MTDFPRAQDLFRVGRDEVVSRAERLTLNAVDRDGTDANIVMYGMSAVGEEVIGQLASVEEGLWLDSATKAKLDKLAWDRYGLLRKPAAPAFVTLTFSCPSASGAAFAIPTNTKVRTADGHEFIVVIGTTFPAGSVGPVYATARSTLAGIDQNVRPGTITSITSQLIGSPVGLTVTNELAAAGGDNAESDDSFKGRIRKFWKSARRGTKGAIEAGALAVPGVTNAVAFEGLTGAGYPNRMVSLVITDAFTDALIKQGVTVPTYETRSQAFAREVWNGLDEYRAWGIAVSVKVAAVQLISVAMRLHFQAGVSDPDLLALYARTMVVQRINELDPGEIYDPVIHTLPILAVIPGLDYKGDEVASPPGTIDPTSPYQVLRTTLALVTVDAQAGAASIPPTFI